MDPNRRMAVLTALFVAVVWGPGWAQTSRVHVGPQLGYDFKIEEPARGAQMSFLIAWRLEFYPSFGCYLVNEGTAWGFNGGPQVAGGKGPSPLKIHPFAEGRAIRRDAVRIQLQTGINITL